MKNHHGTGVTLSPGCLDYKKLLSRELIRAVLTGAVEGKLMRRYFKSLVRQFNWPDLTPVVDQDIIDAIAQLADKMLVPLHQRVEVLRTAPHQHLKFLVGNQLLQVSINRSEADAR